MLERVVVASLAVLGALLLVELSTRAYLFGPAGLDPRRVDSVRGLHEAELLAESPYPEIGWELAPDLDAWFKLARFRTNSRGLRDREYGLERPADTVRVAVVGASYALPAGVEMENAFHSILESRLSAESGSRAFEFINFAVGGYAPRQALAMLRIRALAYDPQLVLFTVTRLSMPLLRGAWNAPVEPMARVRRDRVYLESFLVKLLELRLGRHWIGVWESKEPQRPRGVASVVEKLGELSRATGVPVVVVRLEYSSRPPTPLAQAIEADIREQGLHFIDTRDAFAGTQPRDFWIYELDPHPNPRAHAIFADSVARFLRQHHLLGSREGRSFRVHESERADTLVNGEGTSPW